MRLLLATTNPAKLRDLRAVFGVLDAELVSLADVASASPPTIEETGTTFPENAVLKARGYARHFGIPAVADDGGLEIDALGGKPGIYSRRWPGREASDEELIAYAMERMAGIPKARRGARFRTVVAFATPEGEATTQEADLPGRIAEAVHPKRVRGYPFRSIFFLPDIGKYAVELTDEEQERLSHRRRAFTALLPAIRSYRRTGSLSGSVA